MGTLWGDPERRVHGHRSRVRAPGRDPRDLRLHVGDRGYFDAATLAEQAGVSLDAVLGGPAPAGGADATRLLANFERLWSTKDLGIVEQMVAPDAVAHWSGLGTIAGREYPERMRQVMHELVSTSTSVGPAAPSRGISCSSAGAPAERSATNRWSGPGSIASGFVTTAWRARPTSSSTPHRFCKPDSRGRWDRLARRPQVQPRSSLSWSSGLRDPPAVLACSGRIWLGSASELDQRDAGSVAASSKTKWPASDSWITSAAGSNSRQKSSTSAEPQVLHAPSRSVTPNGIRRRIHRARSREGHRMERRGMG